MPFKFPISLSSASLPSARLLPASRATPALSVYAARPFHSTSFRPAINERDRHQDNLSPDEIQERNEENLQLHKVGKAKWHEGLASNSEADVKADRGDMEGTEEVEEVERLVKRRFTPARPAQMEPEVKENGDKK